MKLEDRALFREAALAGGRWISAKGAATEEDVNCAFNVITELAGDLA